MKLSEFQKAVSTADESSRAPWVGLNQNFFGLIEKIGGIAGAFKHRMRDRGSYSVPSFRSDVERLIGEALWYLASVASHFGLDLEEIANKNLRENKKRWGNHRDELGNLFRGRSSDGFPQNERFPKVVEVEFTSTTGPNHVSWLSITGVKVNGKQFGDPVDDNAATEDGYRFHDVLHFAFAVHLDWSPVIRKLLQNKRKSDPKKDKFDDGARARDTEEAVSNLIHRKAKDNNFFKGAKRLETAFLNQILAQVMDLEVRDRSASELLMMVGT
jgi:NTP pyrophosphatase (non-canonical NTP hydrolase)